MPKQDIAGDKLVFGNDFEHPIRDRLPPLFDKAFGIVKWWIDPGLDGDVYGDEPYLYGALLSSINVLRVGEKAESGKASAEEVKEGEAVVYTEGASGSGEEVRKEQGVPAASAARQKFFLTEANRKNFTFEKGREYQCDFFNPYLDFNEFALKIGYGLPNISIIGHWDGQPLRYVNPLLPFSLPTRDKRRNLSTFFMKESRQADLIRGWLANADRTRSDTRSRTRKPIPSCLSW